MSINHMAAKTAERVLSAKGMKPLIAQIVEITPDGRAIIQRVLSSAPDGPWPVISGGYKPRPGDWCDCFESRGGVIVLGRLMGAEDYDLGVVGEDVDVAKSDIVTQTNRIDTANTNISGLRSDKYDKSGGVITGDVTLRNGALSQGKMDIRGEVDADGRMYTKASVQAEGSVEADRYVPQFNGAGADVGPGGTATWEHGFGKIPDGVNAQVLAPGGWWMDMPALDCYVSRMYPNQISLFNGHGSAFRYMRVVLYK